MVRILDKYELKVKMKKEEEGFMTMPSQKDSFDQLSESLGKTCIPTLEKSTAPRHHSLLSSTEECKVNTDKNNDVFAPIIGRSDRQLILASTKKLLTYGNPAELLLSPSSSSDPPKFTTTTSNQVAIATTLVLVEKPMDTLHPHNEKAEIVSSSRKRIAHPLKTNPKSKSNLEPTTTNNVMTNKRKATSCHHHRRHASSSQPDGSTVTRKVFGDKTNIGNDAHTRDKKCELLVCYVADCCGEEILFW